MRCAAVIRSAAAAAGILFAGEREVTGALLGLVDQLGTLRRPMSRSGLD
jgi:hypothetical protein